MTTSEPSYLCLRLDCRSYENESQNLGGGGEGDFSNIKMYMDVPDRLQKTNNQTNKLFSQNGEGGTILVNKPILNLCKFLTMFLPGSCLDK